MPTRSFVATTIGATLPALIPLPLLAATGDTGTGDISLTGAQLGMLFGGAIVLGIVIWLVIKFLNRK